MGGPRRPHSYDTSVAVTRVGDLVLIRSDRAAELAQIRGEAEAVTAGTARSLQRVPAKEAGLLAFLMHHHQQIVSKTRLIEAVWGTDGVAPGVLDVHIVRLRRILLRLDPTGTQARIETRRGMGYALHVEESSVD